MERYYIGLAVVMLLAGWFYVRMLRAERLLADRARFCQEFRRRMDSIYYPIKFGQISVDRLLSEIAREEPLNHWTPQQLKRLELGMSSEAFVMWEEMETAKEVERRHDEEVLINTRRQNLSVDTDTGCTCCHD